MPGLKKNEHAYTDVRCAHSTAIRVCETRKPTNRPEGRVTKASSVRLQAPGAASAVGSLP